MRVRAVSTPFRNEELALEERLRRAETELAKLDDIAQTVTALHGTRKKNLALAAVVGLVLFLLGTAVGAAMVRRQASERAQSADDAQLQRAAKLAASAAADCPRDLDHAKVNLQGCLGVTERGLASRVELHVFGEPLASPVRSTVARMGIAGCTAPPIHADITFAPDGTVSVVKVSALDRRTKLTANETLCLDQTIRTATVPKWDGRPMLVTADFKERH